MLHGYEDTARGDPTAGPDHTDGVPFIKDTRERLSFSSAVCLRDPNLCPQAQSTAPVYRQVFLHSKVGLDKAFKSTHLAVITAEEEGPPRPRFSPADLRHALGIGTSQTDRMREMCFNGKMLSINSP